MGRLFDAVASLAGICHRTGYDAQAAMELEARARPVGRIGGYRFGPGLDASPVVAAVVEDVLAATDPSLVAARFQSAVVDSVVREVGRLRDETGTATVTLSGGVFLNAFLLEACAADLAEAGFRVLRHRRVPASDAGLALGQVAVLAHRTAASDRGEEPACA
jgi:hydrogenase maturation protein HypF